MDKKYYKLEIYIPESHFEELRKRFKVLMPGTSAITIAACRTAESLVHGDRSPVLIRSLEKKMKLARKRNSRLR